MTKLNYCDCTSHTCITQILVATSYHTKCIVANYPKFLALVPDGSRRTVSSRNFYRSSIWPHSIHYYCYTALCTAPHIQLDNLVFQAFAITVIFIGFSVEQSCEISFCETSILFDHQKVCSYVGVASSPIMFSGEVGNYANSSHP